MTKQTEIVARIARELEEGEPVEGLARRLAPSDLQSLLLHVFCERSARRTPAEILAQYERTAMVRPSGIDPRALLEIERAAFESADGFEALDLSPVAPLGLNRVLGEIDQNNCLAAVRSAELLADPTTVAALECARRRRAGERDTIRLCSRSRPLRLQPFEGAGFSPHFGLFSLVSSGRVRGTLEFETESLREHLRFYLDLLRRLAGLDYSFSSIEVRISETDREEIALERAEAEVFHPLTASFPEATFVLDREREQGRHYYSGLCLRIDATDPERRRLNLADGGFADWTQRLLSNGKERLLVSGIGIQLIASCFRGPRPAGSS
ncbi:MAG TPA: hypothetical protein VGS22_25955 [Thermoanaerobaculia bacterium]|nr:hypothetical protein [Thermoanaerobaculia bacterium]